MVDKLICFDLDDTLIHTMKDLKGKEIWKEKTGKDWPYTGWWSKAETLDFNIFDTPLNPYVYNEYLDVIDDDRNHVILATGRLERLRKPVEALLNKLDLKFDGVYLNTGGDTLRYKCTLFEKLIKKLKPKEFIMYDDRELHIIEFIKWARTMPCNVTVIDVINKKKTLIKN